MSMSDGPKPMSTAKSEQATAKTDATGTPLGASAAVARPHSVFVGWSDRWREMTRQKQWLFLFPIVVFAFFLPVLNIPFITTEPGNDWPLACQLMAIYVKIW